MMIVSTGSKSLDSLLGGGIHSGLVTDFFGKSGTGKSQLCFSLCVNCACAIIPGETIIFIDKSHQQQNIYQGRDLHHYASA